MSIVYKGGRLVILFISQIWGQYDIPFFSCRELLLYKGNFFLGQLFCDEVTNDPGQNTSDEGKGEKYRQKLKEEFLADPKKIDA